MSDIYGIFAKCGCQSGMCFSAREVRGGSNPSPHSKNNRMIIFSYGSISVSKCPECGKNTLESTPRGDNCTNCGYYVYYP